MYNSLDGKQTKRYFSFSWCIACKHFNGKEKGTCKAFPNGIPEKYSVSYGSEMPLKHETIDKNQVGKLTFLKV